MKSESDILAEIDRMLAEDELDLAEFRADKVEKSPAARVTLGRIGALSDLKDFIMERNYACSECLNLFTKDEVEKTYPPELMGASMFICKECKAEQEAKTKPN